MEDKNSIFDRLLQLKIKVEIPAIPTPQYINEKIWECHRYIEEIESFYIRVSKEISVLQQAMNNSQAEYETKKETLLLRDDIRNMPSFGDREAKANSYLRLEMEKIKGYQNELLDLNNLLKAINLKNRNLNRASNDIKMVVRILESQLKMSSGQGMSSTLRGLNEEMSKAVTANVFDEIESKEDQSQVIDPTAKIDVEDLLVKPEEPVIIPPDESLKEELEESGLVAEDENPLFDETKNIDPLLLESEATAIDIDKMIDFSGARKEEGGKPEPTKDEPLKSEANNSPTKTELNPQPKIGIDLNSFLDSLNLN